ncbi:hypothetical protein scyTo_0018759 [Scyliorhinus torazame]|uniref:Uncharacterized protein n=1 Tax=Scyliorhinus torazame TaxID=75743 RepID=A0A401Q298_SCYTO|nr:hypothetical protein [Scyliorhinus torazame]
MPRLFFGFFLQSSPDALTTISNAVNSQGIVVPTSALQQGNAAMATQVVTGGTIYQPVTMVTSQGQVVTQAIPQGTIQIQNTQVRDVDSFYTVLCVLAFEVVKMQAVELLT